jgi:hypothetical protein
MSYLISTVSNDKLEVEFLDPALLISKNFAKLTPPAQGYSSVTIPPLNEGAEK